MNLAISRLTSTINSLVVGGTPVSLNGKRVGTLRVLSGPPPDVSARGYDPDTVLRLTFGSLTLKGGGVVVVVVKSLGDESSPSNSGKEDKAWSDVSHPNVLALLGETWFNSSPSSVLEKYLVSPFLYNGNIVHYLRQHPAEYNEKRLVEFISQMLAGIVHIHGKNWAHGDFKLDNVLVNDSRQAVICDFGLSTEIVRGPNHLPTTDYVRSLGPKRYHSAEILNLGVRMLNATVPLAGIAGNDQALRQSPGPSVPGKSPCRKSPESDIWAFGMAILHLYSGQWPWKEVDNDSDLGAYIQRGLRPRFPADASVCKIPIRVWKHCGDCWEQLPRHRPTATELMARFQGPSLTLITSDMSRADLRDLVEQEVRILTGEVVAGRIDDRFTANGVTTLSGVWAAPEGNGKWGTPVSLKRNEDAGGSSDGWSQTLLVEVLYWSQLRHHALMPLLGACRLDGMWHAVFPHTKKSQWFRHYIEELDGEDSPDPTLPDASRLKMLLDICGALSFMHSQNPPFAHGAVHLDNIYVGTMNFRRPEDLTIDAYLCDFRHVQVGDKAAVSRDLRDFGELVRTVLKDRYACKSEHPLLKNTEIAHILRLCSAGEDSTKPCTIAEEIRAALRVLAETTALL